MDGHGIVEVRSGKTKAEAVLTQGRCWLHPLRLREQNPYEMIMRVNIEFYGDSLPTGPSPQRSGPVYGYEQASAYFLSIS